MSSWGPLKSIEAPPADAAHKLHRTLGWPHLVALGVGAIVGTGILTLTGVGAALAGPGVILSFLIAGAVCAAAALAYAELAATIPQSGSAYTYSYVAVGETIAWLADEVEKSCPILNLLRAPQSLRRTLHHQGEALRSAAE